MTKKKKRKKIENQIEKMANGEAPSQLTENCKIYQNYEENYEKKPKFERKMNFENRVYVKKKSLVYLWSFLILYLTLGAVIISQIEHNKEVELCKSAEEKLNHEMEELGESYLYAFGWDVKFCTAIEEFFDEQQTRRNFQKKSEYPPVILHLIRTFYNEDCSRAGFDHLISSLDILQSTERVDLITEFQKAFNAINALAKFDEIEKAYFVANGKEYKVLVWNTTTFMIDTASEYKEVCFSKYSWSFRSGLRYSFSLISTVGYGDYTAQTKAGKIFTFFYMMIGIPAFLLATILSAMAIRSSLQEDNLLSLGSFFVFGIILLVIIPSLLTSYIYPESKTILDQIYFRFISITTVGFGDIIPFNSPPKMFSSAEYDQNQCLHSIFDGIFNDYNGQVAAEIESTCSPPVYNSSIHFSFIIYETINYILILFGIIWFSTILLVGWKMISHKFTDTFSVEDISVLIYFWNPI